MATPDPFEPSGGAPPITGVPPEDSCDENPLLARCVRATPTPAPPAVPSTPAPRQASSVQQVQNVLFESCGSCHGGDPIPELCGTCDGMYNVENLRRLIQSGNILPCRWEDSPVFQRIADGSMPPKGEASAPTAEEMALLGDFVNGLCSDLTQGGAADTQRVNIESWLGADCGSCHGPTAAEAGGSAPSTLDGVGDVAELIATGLIVPCDVNGSELVRVLREDTMPPPGSSGPRPGRPELADLIDFIKRPCALR